MTDHPASSPPTSVEEARPTYSPAVQEAFDWAYTSGIDAEKHPKYLHALIAAVRAGERECLNGLLREERKIVRASVLSEVREVLFTKTMHDGEECDSYRLPPTSGLTALDALRGGTT